MHAGVITLVEYAYLPQSKNIYSVGVGSISEDVPLPQSSRNHKFATSVIRMVFKPLETFAESFQLSDFNEKLKFTENQQTPDCSYISKVTRINAIKTLYYRQ